MKIVALVVCTSRVVKMKEYLPFWRDFKILKIELLLTMLSNFEIDTALQGSALCG